MLGRSVSTPEVQPASVTWKLQKRLSSLAKLLLKYEGGEQSLFEAQCRPFVHKALEIAGPYEGQVLCALGPAWCGRIDGSFASELSLPDRRLVRERIEHLEQLLLSVTTVTRPTYGPAGILAQLKSLPTLVAQEFRNAVSHGDTTTAKLLLHNHQVQTSDFLVDAVHSGNLETVTLLLANGADANATAKRESALSAAAKRGHLSILKYLLASHGNPNRRHDLGNTPLIEAVLNNRKEAAEMLLACGASASIATNNGNSALHFAALKGNVDIVALLIPRTPLDLKNNSGYTALHNAAEHGHETCALLLLRAGANPHLLNSHGRSVFDVASQNLCEVLRIANYADRKCNVLLLGSTGSGKSTFGNFFNDPFGSGGSPASLFVEADFADPGPTTQTVRAATTRVRCSAVSADVDLYDTPGLNEVQASNDLAHMRDLLLEISKLPYVSCAILCVRFGAKMDAQLVETIKYYHRLLQPLFAARSVILVLTNVSPDDYKRFTKAGTWEGEKLKMLYAVNEHVGGVIDICEALDSCPSPQEMRHHVHSFGSLDLQRHAFATPLIAHSLTVRERVRMLVLQMREVSLANHLFRLPPVYEQLRCHIVSRTQEERGALLSTIDVEAAQRNEVLKRVSELQRSINECKHAIAVQESNRSGLCAIQRVAPIFIASDSLFHLSREEVTLEATGLAATLLFDDLHIRSQLWNAALEFPQGDAARRFPMAIKVLPDWIHISRHKEENCRWFCRVWIEYDGEKGYKKEIDECDANIEELNKQMAHARAKLATLKETDNKLEKRTKEHMNELDIRSDLLALLAREKFELGSLNEVLTVLTPPAKK